MNNRIAQLLIVAVTAVVILAAGTSAFTAQAHEEASPLLFPLSERDLNSASGSGCEISFYEGARTYVYAVGNELMIKTGAGRAVCPISDQQLVALAERGGSHSCGGTSLTIRQTGGLHIQEASDSSSAPATLTVTERGRSWTLRGDWGTAC